MKITLMPISIVLLLCVIQVYADTPANCTYEDIRGTWTFYETARNMTSAEDCNTMSNATHRLKISLRYPNIAVDEFGNLGTWTMVYNEGFEVTVNERTYFAFSYYKKDGEFVTSYCSKTTPGWSHDTTLRHWACFYGRKQKHEAPKFHQDPFHSSLLDRAGPSNADFRVLVDSINSHQSNWRADVPHMLVNKSPNELLKIRGGKRSWLAHWPKPAPTTHKLLAATSKLPLSFDWRNVSGVNYVSPVRNQASCGSCYAFSSMGMLEARVRVKTRNTHQPQFSPQEIVSCSSLSQGCEGGFPYLIAGRYGKDYGVVLESCNPYQGHDSSCPRMKCYRYYTASYSYVGGYYGACNEEHMKLALVTGGPISVSFMVHKDFMAYKGGIYHYTGLEHENFNPYVLVNHAVLLVGYGQDDTGEKFWIVKNSWGEDWGENGYFRIRRGTNEVGIESIAVEVTPIP